MLYSWLYHVFLLFSSFWFCLFLLGSLFAFLFSPEFAEFFAVLVLLGHFLLTPLSNTYVLGHINILFGLLNTLKVFFLVFRDRDLYKVFRESKDLRKKLLCSNGLPCLIFGVL